MNPEVGTPQVAVQVPSSERAKYLSTEYPCLLSLDGETQHLGFLDVAKIFGPQPDRLDFTFTASWYTGQYSTISIKINVATTSGQRQEVGRIVIKGHSNKSLKSRILTDESLASELAVFCGFSFDHETGPTQLVKIGIECGFFAISVSDQAMQEMTTRHPALATGLKTMRDTIRTGKVKNIGLTILSRMNEEFRYVETLAKILENATESDKNSQDETSQHERPYPFWAFFPKSRRAMQLHYGNAPSPNSEDFPEDMKTQILPAVDVFDTEEEQLVALVMGQICDHMIALDANYNLKQVEANAWAIQLQHHNNEAFLLIVQSFDADGVSQPREGELCYVQLQGIRRKEAALPRVFTPYQIQSSVKCLGLASDEERDPVAYVTRTCGQYFRTPEHLTPKIANDILRQHEETPAQYELRIVSMVQNWCDADILRVTGAGDAEPQPFEACDIWQAVRISLPNAFISSEYSAYFVTLPLVPKSEVLEGETRSVINVEFPMLKWEVSDENMADEKYVEARTVAHLSDSQPLKVKFQALFSAKVARALISSINDLHAPQSADPHFPVTERSKAAYVYLQNFRSTNTSNVFEKYPHMGYIFGKPNEVPAFLSAL